MIYLAIILLTLGVVTVMSNIGGCVAVVRRMRKGIDGGCSNVPLISLICCAGAWAFARDSLGLWAFLPALMDPGTWMLIGLPKAPISCFGHDR